MQPITPALLLFHGDYGLRENLRGWAGRFNCVLVKDWSDLRKLVRRTPVGSIVIVDPFLDGEPPARASDALRTFLGELPSVAVVAALTVCPTDAELLRTLFRWGVAEVIATNRENTPAALARRLRMVQARRLERLLERTLPRGTPSRSRALLTRAAEVVAVGGKAPELAAALGVGERSVPRRCERADLPPPRRLLAWLRLLLAADLLDDRGRSVASVARACGYASETTLKAACLRFTGAPPAALRRGGAFTTVSRTFARELFKLREQARERGRKESTWLL